MLTSRRAACALKTARGSDDAVALRNAGLNMAMMLVVDEEVWCFQDVLEIFRDAQARAR